MTVKGIECLRGADVVVHDYLVGKEIMRHAGKDARLVYAGKIGGRNNISQEKLNRILVEEAMKGNTVARLKGEIHSYSEGEAKKPNSFRRRECLLR